MKTALNAFDELPAAPTPALLEETSQRLTRCYRRLLFIDKFNTVLIKKIGVVTAALANAKAARDNLEHQYRKLYYVDNYNVIIISSTETVRLFSPFTTD